MRLGEKFAFYNVNNKPTETFERQLKMMGAPVVIESFISPAEVELLIQIEKELGPDQKIVRPPRQKISYIMDTWLKDKRTAFLLNRLYQHFGKFSLWGGNYFHVEFPYLPHVDNGENITVANYKNIVIPLAMRPSGLETQLIIFKQRYFGDNTIFFRSGVGIDKSITYTNSLYDYSKILGLEQGTLIDRASMESLLGHINPVDLEGLTISHVIPWKVGSCIAFDSSQIHCAADFRRVGIEGKFGLSLFTTLN